MKIEAKRFLGRLRVILQHLSCLSISIILIILTSKCSEPNAAGISSSVTNKHTLAQNYCKCSCDPMTIDNGGLFYCNDQSPDYLRIKYKKDSSFYADSCLLDMIKIEGCWLTLNSESNSASHLDLKRIVYEYFKKKKLNQLSILGIIPGTDLMVMPSEIPRVLLVEVSNYEDSIHVESLFSNTHTGLGDTLVYSIFADADSKKLFDDYLITRATIPVSFFERGQLETWEEAGKRHLVE